MLNVLGIMSLGCLIYHLLLTMNRDILYGPFSSFIPSAIQIRLLLAGQVLSGKFHHLFAKSALSKMGVEQSVIEKQRRRERAASNLAYFDHTFVCALETFGPALNIAAPSTLESNYSDAKVIRSFGVNARVCDLIFYPDRCALREATSISKSRLLVEVLYDDLSQITFDHSVSAVKIAWSRDHFIIVNVDNSLEIDSEFTLRLKGRKSPESNAARKCSVEYLGVYAMEKPKPFQRKRGNLSARLPQGSNLPPIVTMRAVATASYRGSGRPSTENYSRRRLLALEHIHCGTQTFRVQSIRGLELAVSNLIVYVTQDYEQISLHNLNSVDAFWFRSWNELLSYEVIDRVHHGGRNNGIKFKFVDTEQEVLIVVSEVRLFMHTTEFFYNLEQERRTGSLKFAKRQTTHGRRVLSVATLFGESPAPEMPKGIREVRDVEGTVVRPAVEAVQGSMSTISSSAARQHFRNMSQNPSSWRSSVNLLGTAQPITGLLRENPVGAAHWSRSCIHNGWLWKKGGLAWTWQPRYVVLYRTAQGHFLCYYTDFSDSPLYSSKNKARNVIDLCRSTFIRPMSSMPEAPTFAFDVCTIDREWTLCPATRQEQQVWLQLITRAIDEDVAVLPDDRLSYVVKARVDPSGQLSLHEYTTCLRISASGVSVDCLDDGHSFREVMFWCYTDFFKWSVVSYHGKIGLNLSIYSSHYSDSRHKQEFLFRSREASLIASAIEFYIEKFVAIMLLWQEGEVGDEEEGGIPAEAPVTDEASESARSDTMNMATDVGCYENNDEVADLLEGYGEEELDKDTQPIVDPFDGLDAPVVLLPAEKTIENLPPTSVEQSMSPPPQRVPSCTVFPITPALQPAHALFRNEILEVSVDETFYSRSHGKLEIYVKSLAPKLESFGLSILNIKTAIGIDDITPGALEHELSRAPLILEAGGSFKMVLMVKCLKPFEGSPSLEFSYVHGSEKYNHKIILPVNVLRFVEPFPMAVEDVRSKWEAMSSREDLEMRGSIRPLNPMTVSELTRKFQKLTNMAVVHEFQTVSDTRSTVAVGTLYTETLGLDGNKVSSGCISALEPVDGSWQSFNLTVRASIGSVARCIYEATKQALET